jgi:chloride channel protein, CIC family
MRKYHIIDNTIPISISLDSLLDHENLKSKDPYNKNRLFTITGLSVLIAICVSLIAKLLVFLIDLITNISFYGNFSIEPSSPANNHYGIFVIVVPAVGGLIVGAMALYGSKAIRGHGIPEAMEQILTNQSKIKPSITYLKPLSAAISIGTGGPFGAEGPIIATGGALGSTIGQILKITHNERKILLAAGATGGMSAIFGSPVAAIFLAIELLLFEFSPRSIIPISLACIIGAAGHHWLFKNGVVFPINGIIQFPSNQALFYYCLMGIIIGVLSIGVTKIVYVIEDGFEKLPVHWALWPAIGGLFVGSIGYLAPRTLGVGYNNIIDILSGGLSLQILISLCVLKFISWAVSLGSGTSGGTLAPLLTIGGATGALLGSFILYWFPSSGITIPLAALVGMSAMFAGASRAFLTSIIFALETTGQYNALLPLLTTCTTAYFVSYFFMENTIMTEKIARRGVATPHSYEPDVLGKLTVAQVLNKNGVIVNEEYSIKEVIEWLNSHENINSNYFIVSNNNDEYKGILSSVTLLNSHTAEGNLIGTIVKPNENYVELKNTLRTAVETMARNDIDVLPVISKENSNIIGCISYHDIIAIYRHGAEDHEKKQPHISLRRQGLKILLHGKKLVSVMKK